MPRAKPIQIGDEHFRTQKDAMARVRALISKYDIGQFIEGDDRRFCEELFRHHSEYAQKVGPGIRRVEVQMDMYGNKHFQIHRLDGTDDDISWVHCVTGR